MPAPKYASEPEVPRVPEFKLVSKRSPVAAKIRWWSTTNAVTASDG